MARGIVSYLADVEVLGLEVKKIPIPKKLLKYEDQPLSSYKVYLKYRWQHKKYPNKLITGRCMLVLKTQFKYSGDLVIVQGQITIKSAPARLPSTVNYKPKKKLDGIDLSSFVIDYLSAQRCLSNEALSVSVLGQIKNSLITCNFSEHSMVDGYNSDGTLDQVSVEMSLFEPV